MRAASTANQLEQLARLPEVNLHASLQAHRCMKPRPLLSFCLFCDASYLINNRCPRCGTAHPADSRVRPWTQGVKPQRLSDPEHESMMIGGRRCSTRMTKTTPIFPTSFGARTLSGEG